jgi:hypothetical protein
MEYQGKNNSLHRFRSTSVGGFERCSETSDGDRPCTYTATARFGLFVSWIATAVALVLAGVGAVIFYNEPVPISASAWIVSGGRWAVASTSC